MGQVRQVEVRGSVLGHPRVTIREVMMGEGNRVASVIMLTFKKMPAPHAETAWAVVC